MINYTTLTLPTPFTLKTVNVYIIKNEPVTLVDCGTYAVETKTALRNQLNNIGLKIEDIKQIIVTHAHPDHCGLAAEIQRVSRAPIYMHKKDIYKAQNYSQFLNHSTSYLKYSGMTDKLCKFQHEYLEDDLKYLQYPEEIISVEDGHIFSFEGCEIEAIYTPGHSIGHLCLFQEAEGLIFSGDTILEKIIPNPVLEPIIGTLDREKGIMNYMNSINRLKELKVHKVLPGHGKVFSDMNIVLERLNTHHQKRLMEINEIAFRKKVFNPFELTMDLKENFRNPMDICFTMNEVLGYLDILESEGKIFQNQKTNRLVYSWN